MARLSCDDSPGKGGAIFTVAFTVTGIPVPDPNRGPAFRHGEAFSFRPLN